MRLDHRFLAFFVQHSVILSSLLIIRLFEPLLFLLYRVRLHVGLLTLVDFLLESRFYSESALVYRFEEFREPIHEFH